MKISTRRANINELNLCHESNYIDLVQKKSNDNLVHKYFSRKIQENSVCFTNDKFDCACLAVGCLLSIIDDVFSCRCLNGAAIIRPPGHHATSDTSAV